MHFRRWTLVACVPIAAGLALFAPSLRGGPGAAARPGTSSAEGEESREAADLVAVTDRAPAGVGTEALIEAPPAHDGARVSAAQTEGVDPGHDAPSELDALVMGVLTDAAGVPLAGRTVTLRGQTQLDFDPETDDFPVTISSIDPFMIPRDPQSGTTDSTGAFVFEGSSTRFGGELVYGGDVLLGGPKVAKVDPDVEWQVLRLPRLEHQDCVWTVDVVDRERRSLAIESVDLELVGPPRSANSRAPWPSERVVSIGAIEQRGLTPGKWRMSVRPAGGITTTIEASFTMPDAEVHSVLELDVLAGTHVGDVGPSVNDDGTTWVDPASGLLELLPEDIVGVGESALNRHFAQTLRVGHGPVRAAELTVRVRAMLHNAENDAIYLEHLGERKYAWSARISTVLGRPWNKGDTATLRLDLSRLPGGEESVDLRPFLEDGLLDVVVQDDTTIESISARVIR